MSFLMRCPNCGARSVYEFRFGGEYRIRPQASAPDNEWLNYVYNRTNINGLQKEWWYHRDGCGEWFVAERDTTSNLVTLAIGCRTRDDDHGKESPTRTSSQQVDRENELTFYFEGRPVRAFPGDTGRIRTVSPGTDNFFSEL